MKIAYFGYDFFYNLFEYFLSSNKFEVGALFTFKSKNPMDYNYLISGLAEHHNIPIYYDKVMPVHMHMLNEQKFDLIFSAGYIYKIPVWESLVPYAVNMHPGLLPECRGYWYTPYVILNGDNTAGVTMHKITSGFDKGDIINKYEFPVYETDNAETISCRMQIGARKILEETMNNFPHYWENAKPQKTGGYFKIPTEEMRTINWNDPVADIHKKVRAFGKECSYAKFGGKKWVIKDAACWKEEHTIKPGTVVHKTNAEVVVAAADGFVCIRYYQEFDENISYS